MGNKVPAVNVLTAEAVGLQCKIKGKNGIVCDTWHLWHVLLYRVIQKSLSISRTNWNYEKRFTYFNHLVIRFVI